MQIFRRYFCETCKRCSVKSINARSAGEIHLPLWYSNCDVTEKAGPAQALNGISIEQKNAATGPIRLPKAAAEF